MSRLIDADALCKDLLERWHTADTQKEELISAVLAEIVTPIVISQPTIKPEQKKGKWRKIDDDGIYECSACGIVWTFIEGTPEDNNCNFCPACGARMERGEKP